MYNNKKRGQAALEFLMTYGWAILSAIIVIGALGSYFYFNQGGSSTLYVTAPFYGVAASASEDLVNLEISYKGGEAITAVTVNVTGQGCTADAATFDETDTNPQIIPLVCTGADSNVEFKGNIVITYLRPGSALPLTATGSVATPVA